MFRLPRLVSRYTRVASVALAAGVVTVAAPSCAPEKDVKVAAAAASPLSWVSGLFGGGASGVNYSAVAQSIADILDNIDHDDGVRRSRSPQQPTTFFNPLLPPSLRSPTDHSSYA
jgi:hypothetical protein